MQPRRGRNLSSHIEPARRSIYGNLVQPRRERNLSSHIEPAQRSIYRNVVQARGEKRRGEVSTTLFVPPVGCPPLVQEDATTNETGNIVVGPVFGALLAYQKWADAFSEWTGRIAAWAVIPTVAIGFVNVILRYSGQLMGRQLTSNAIIELQLYLYGSIFLLGFAYVLKHQINVRVDFWYAHQPVSRRVWIDFWGNWIALIPFCIIGMWASFPQAWQSISVWEMSPDANGLPRGPIKALLAVSFLLLFLQAISEQIKLYAVLTGRGDKVHYEEAHEHLRIE